MQRAQRLVLPCVVALLGAASDARGQDLRIGIIDFYGLNRLSAADLRPILTFKEGDVISRARDQRSQSVSESERRLSMVSGVVGARINIVCCDDGRAIFYVGIHEDGVSLMRFRAPPEGDVRLARDVIQAGIEFSKALAGAVQRGDAGEDRSEGHALAHDPAMHALQDRFIIFARRDLPTLREVLRHSSVESERALAAQVLGYVADKQAVVDDFVVAMSDPSEDVRNNAMRALMVFAERTATTERPALRVPFEPFIALLNSPVWSDRNKASGALAALSQRGTADLFQRLRADATRSLVEMARWKSAGHALAPFLVIAHMAGYSDEAAMSAWARGEREEVIRTILTRQ